MAEMNDVFHFNGQKYTCVGSVDHTTKRGQTTALSVWETACPSCGVLWRLNLGAQFPLKIQSLRRRCDSCKAPGKAVSEYTARQTVADQWRPDAWRAIRDAAMSLDAYGDEGNYTTAADIVRELQQAPLETTVKNRLNLDKPHASTWIGKLLREMEDRNLARHGPRQGEWVVTDLDDAYYDIEPKVLERRHDVSVPAAAQLRNNLGRSKSLDRETLMDCCERNSFSPEQYAAWVAMGSPRRAARNSMDERFVGKTAAGQPAAKQRLLNFLLAAAQKAANNPTRYGNPARYFDFQGFRESLKTVVTQDHEAKDWVTWLAASDQALSGLIGQLYLAGYIVQHGSGFVLKG